MDKQNQIEEMARIICDNYNNGGCEIDGYVCNYRCSNYVDCERLYNAGYRKIPEGAVVLSFEDLVMRDEKIKTLCKRKTAEKFAERLKSHPIAKTWFLYNADGKINVVIDEICKELIGEKK